jgi:hypothetical protein
MWRIYVGESVLSVKYKITAVNKLYTTAKHAQRAGRSAANEMGIEIRTD